MKKAVSAATSAALLASLLATAVAPAASADVVTGITGIGNVPYPGSSGVVTVSLHEQHVGDLIHTGYLYITLHHQDKATPPAYTLNTPTWTGTPVLSTAAGSLGASVSISGPVMSIKITGYDTSSTEDIVVTGVKVKSAAAEDISAELSDSIGGPINDGLAGAFVPLTTTASGTLQTFNQTDVTVNVTSACGFEPYATASHGATFGSQTGVQIISATGTVPGVQSIVLSAALTGAHVIGEAVTQTVANCNLAYPYKFGVIGTGKPTLSYGADAAKIVYAGETNANAAHLYFQEPAPGYLTSSPATTLTLTIATAGVTFSKLPTLVVDCSQTNILFKGQLEYSTATSTWVPAIQHTPLGTCQIAPTNPTLNLAAGTYEYAPPVMSADHKSVSLTVATASTLELTAGTGFTLADIHYDVAASVPGGTYVEVDAALNNSLFVHPTYNNNAIVFRGVAAMATPTTVFIGQNNQKAGKLSFTESQAGFFADISNMSANSAGANTFGVCLDGPDYFDPGNVPYAQVTAGTGVLVLRDGAAASTTGLVAGTTAWNPFTTTQCYTWTVWKASTTASTITIGYKDMSSGAWIDVPPNAVPGPVNMNLWIGINGDYYFFNNTPAAVVTVANRVFQNQVAVTALSQPTIGLGTVGLAGDLQIAETGIGQLKLGEDVCVMVMPRVAGADTSVGQIHTSGSPLATATGGLVLDRVSLWVGRDCDGRSHVGPNDVYAFHFSVLQQSTNGTGKIVISNIHYIVPADAVVGNVLVNVYGYGVWPTELSFQSQVSNAKIGVSPAISIGAVSALGLNPTSGYTTKTPKTQAVGKYITWKFTGGTALAGQRVNVLVAQKINGAWGGPKYLKSAWADANGIVTFAWTSKAGTALNVRVQWPGTTSYSVSYSKALGAYWK